MMNCQMKIPPLQDCYKPNLMSDCPQPECPWEDADKYRKQMYRRLMLLGVLFAAATLGVLYYMGFLTKPDPGPEKKIVSKKKSKRPVVKDPANSSDIPKKVPYLLVGGGTASFSAFRAIKSLDPTAKVLVVTNESFYPYMRPPLSKEIWSQEDKEAVKKLLFKQWNGAERNLFYEVDAFYTKCKDLMISPNGGIAVARGYTVSHLDVLEKKAILDDGYEIEYDKCLIATGATPKTLSVFEVASSDPVVEDRVKFFRNIYDFEDINESWDETKSIAIVGGGFLGSELACALARKGKSSNKEIYQIFREGGSLGKILPEYLSFWTTEKVKSEGVTVMPKAEIVGVKSVNDKVNLTLSTGKNITVDEVIVAVGVEPNTDLAEKSNLEIDPELGGYLVNTELLARSNLYIAGDCACFYDARLGRRRIEHHDHAVVTGRLAGENMTGSNKPYLHQSMFWSDLGPDVGFEAIGIVDSSLPTVGVFAKANSSDTPLARVNDEGSKAKDEAEVPKECEKYTSEEDRQKAEEAKKEEQKRKEASKPNKAEGEDYGKGIIFYLRDDVVVGMVLWNVYNRISVARQVLQDERKYDDLNEVAKLFNIHEE